MTGNSPAPLRMPEMQQTFQPSRERSVIDETWARLERTMPKVTPFATVIHAMREAYIAALYAASAAISTERAHSRELAEAASRIETRTKL